MLSTLLSLLLMCGIFLLAGGLGLRLSTVGRLFPVGVLRGDRFLYSMAIGLGAISLIVFGLGLAGFLYPVVLFSVLGVIGLFCWRQCVETGRLAGTLALAPWKASLQLLTGSPGGTPGLMRDAAPGASTPPLPPLSKGGPGGVFEVKDGIGQVSEIKDEPGEGFEDEKALGADLEGNGELREFVEGADIPEGAETSGNDHLVDQQLPLQASPSDTAVVVAARPAEPSRGWGIWLLLLLVLGVIHSVALLIGSLAPPADSSYDVLTYHFGVPALYLRWHQIRYDPYIMHSNFPQVTEMLYLLTLAARIGGGQAIHFVLGVLTAGVCWSLARPYGRIAACTAMLVFWFTPVVGWEASVGYDDLGFALFESLAFLAVVRYGEGWVEAAEEAKQDASARRWLILAGICQGLALGVKYSALALAPLLLLLVCLYGWRERKSMGERSLTARLIRDAGIVTVWMALVASPWYLRTLLWTGNPVFPFAYSLLGGKNWTAEAANHFRLIQVTYGAGNSPLDLLLAPWRLLVSPVPFYEPSGGALFSILYGCLGPAFLLLPGVVAFRGGWHRAAALLSILFTLFFVEWFFLMQQVRYLICALPLLAPVEGLAFESLPGESAKKMGAGAPRVNSFAQFVRPAAALLLTLSFAWTTWWSITAHLIPEGRPGSSNASSALLYDLGLETADDYLSDRLTDLWPVSQWVARNVPPNEAVALVREPRGYYMGHETLWADGFEQEKLRYTKMKDVQDLVRALRQQGIRWVVIRVGSPYGLAAALGKIDRKQVPRWNNFDYTGPDGHWASLYSGAVRSGLLVQQYPNPPPDRSDIVTDLAGYGVYRLSGR